MILHSVNKENISGKVELNPFIHLFWLDALADFASSVRIRIGLRQIVKIDDEIWYINSAGDLVISASIEPETICMVIPRGLWEWL